MDITVALGGGGVRGAAHIGVLRVLERSGFSVKAIAGTSIGSLIAAFYASGRNPDQIEEIIANVDQSKLYGWPLSDGPGLLGVKGISDFLNNIFGDTELDALVLPCAAVAVDLYSNREIIIQKGRVCDAILGSIAVPGLFPPRILDGYYLIDGGTLDPVPVRAARGLAPGLPVVAVSLLPPLDLPSTPLGIVSLPGSIPLAKQLARMNIAQAFQIFADSVDIASRQMAELRFALDEPELIIRPDVRGINLLDRVDVHEVAKRGEVAAEVAVPTLSSSVSAISKAKKNLRRFLRKL